MNTDSSQLYEQHIIDLLTEILKWTKIGALDLRETLAKQLATDQHRIVYELTDGNRTSRDIASLSKVSFTTVAKWWRQWAELGFVDPSPKRQGRWQKLCSLRLLGIPVLDIQGEGEQSELERTESTEQEAEKC